MYPELVVIGMAITFIVGYVVGKCDNCLNGKEMPIKKCNAEIKKELDLMPLVDRYLMEECLRRSIRDTKGKSYEPVGSFASDLVREPEKYQEFRALLKWDRIGNQIIWMAAEVIYPTHESNGKEYGEFTMPIIIDPNYYGGYGGYGLMLKPQSYNWVFEAVLKAENMLRETEEEGCNE